MNNFNANHEEKVNLKIDQHICDITPHIMIPSIEDKYDTTNGETESIIKKLKTKKAGGPDKTTIHPTHPSKPEHPMETQLPLQWMGKNNQHPHKQTW